MFNIKTMLIIGALLTSTGCAAHASSMQNDTIAVAVEAARAAGTEAAYSGPATVEAAHRYRLAFEIPGRVTSVNADVGDRVHAGETLASIDASSYREQYDAAAAQAASAAAQAQRALDGSRPQEVDEARAQLARAQAAADLADADARRARMLYEGGAISAQSEDEAVQRARDAHGALDAAHAQLSLAGAGERAEDRSAAVASAGAARAQAELAGTTLAKTSIAAPVDAYVQSRSIEIGDEAEPGTVVFELTDARAPDVRANIPERIAAHINPGDGATIILGESRLRATVTRIEPAADPITRTRQVRLRADDLNAQPGTVVSVELGTTRMHGATVPLGAVIADGASAYVEIYRIADSTVQQHDVRVLGSNGDRAIVSGIEPGTPVVVAGQYEARDGARVRLVAKDGSQ